MTIYNVTDSALSEVTQQLRRKYVKFDRMHPSNSVEWLIQNGRDYAGFVSVQEIGLDQDATVFLRRSALLQDVEPSTGHAGIEFKEGKVIITLQPAQIDNLGIFHDPHDESTREGLIEVSEVVFTG